MPHWLEGLGLFVKPPDLRSRREVDDEIAAEIEFHLAERATDLERGGLAADAARLEAERRFGDRARVTKECRQAQIGERLMLQRIQAGLLVALLGVVGWLAWQNHVSERTNADVLARMATQLEQVQTALATVRAPAPGASAPEDAAQLAAGVDSTRTPIDDGASAALLARLDSEPDQWRIGMDTGEQLARRPPEEGWRIVREIWPKIGSVEHRRQLLKGFAFESFRTRLHPHVLDVLDLGARDPDVTVQNVAFTYLRRYAFEDFSRDFDAYLAWSRANAGRPVDVVMVDSARAFAARFKAATGPEAARLRSEAAGWWYESEQRDGPDLAKVLRDEGVVDVVVRWLDEPDQLLHEAAVGWLATLQVDFATLRGWLDRGGAHAWVAQKVVEHGAYKIAPAEIERLLAADDYTLQSLALGKVGSVDLNAEEGLRRRILDLVTARDELDGWTASAAFQALARPGYRFAVEPLLDLVVHSPPSKSYFNTAVHALGQIGDARAIPTLIAARIATTDRSQASLLVGNGLEPLTGVEDWSHDGAWWKSWWDANRSRFPEEVRNLPLPTLAWASE